MPESLLYQAIQDFIPPTKFINTTQVGLKAMLTTWIDVLIEHKLPATIWLKLPSNLLTEVEPYLKEEYAEEIYWCRESQQTFSLPMARKKAIYFDLNNSSALIRESFLLVKSVRFSGLMFVSRNKTNEFQLTYSFDLKNCRDFLNRLEDAITIDDQTSLEVLTKSSSRVKNWQTTDTNLLTSLLLKQATAFQEMGTDNASSRLRENNLEQMQQSLKVQENFLRQLTEEMRLPLTNMKTALTLLESPSIKIQQRQRYVELLEEQWKRQYALWSALLEWVQIEEVFSIPGSALINCELELVLFNLVSLYQSIAQEKEITLTYNLPVGLPKIQCPEFCLQRILTHILDNSLKFTRARGKVSIFCSLVSDSLELTIKDTGIGIRNNELSKIFDSFYQGHNATKDPIAAGLGLTLVKLMLQHCQGSIRVKSQPNEGSSFKVILPISVH